MSETRTTPPPRSKLGRMLKNRLFVVLCIISASTAVLILGILLVSIFVRGVEHLDGDFLSGVPSRRPSNAGIMPAMFGTIWVCLACALFAIPLGVGTAILLEEFKPKTVFLARLHSFVQLNITNLAGVPSIVYGVLGLTAFVQLFGVGTTGRPFFEIGVQYYDQVVDVEGTQLWYDVDDADAPVMTMVDDVSLHDRHGNPFTINVVTEEELTALRAEGASLAGVVLAGAQPQRMNDKSWWYLRLPLGRGVLAGGLTLMLVVLPIVIIASQESLRAVPDSLRQGALALGGTRWQVVRGITLPAAVPGIMTGAILAMSRAIGEAAPILVIAGIVYITFAPQHLMDDFTAMPLQIFNWAGRPREDFHDVAAAGIVVLLVVLLTFNATAVFIRQKFQRSL